jgi:ADP-heptose:LPS heptosyltransferase
VEILILHPGALGDIILSLPAVRALREEFPGARITLAANTDFAAAVAKGYADRVLALSALPLHRLFGEESLPPEDERFWLGFDRIVSWMGARVEGFTGKLARFHPGALAASWMPERAEPRHVAGLFLDSLLPWLSRPISPAYAPIGIEDAVLRDNETWLRQKGWRQDRPLFALHPGAGSRAKRWPLANFSELGRRLKMQGDLLILEGPAERRLGADLAAALGSPAILLADLPLPSVAAALSLCHSFIGNDSGIAHLAAGLGTPSAVLFGPTLPEQWVPLGAHVVVLREAAGCPACASGAGANHRCMENIPVQGVWQKAMCLRRSG